MIRPQPVTGLLAILPARPLTASRINSKGEAADVVPCRTLDVHASSEEVLAAADHIYDCAVGRIDHRDERYGSCAVYICAFLIRA